VWTLLGGLHDTQQMFVRLQSSLKNTPPTVREMSQAARGHKRALAAILPTDGEWFRSHATLSDIIGLT